MQEQFAEILTHFRTQYALTETHLNGARESSFHAMRRAAMDRLETLQFPARKNEDWKYTNVAPLLKPKYQFKKARHVGFEPELPVDGHILVIENGSWNQEASRIATLPAGVYIKTLSDAVADPDIAGLANRQIDAWGESYRAFIALNQAFAEGLVIQIDAHVVVDKPIYLLQRTQGLDAHTILHPQIILVAGENSEATFVESHSAPTSENQYFKNTLTTVEVAKNARITHHRLQREAAQATHFNHTSISQDRDSVYRHLNIDIGSNVVRNNIQARHRGQGITTDMYGIYLASDKQHIDNQTFIDHAFPHCQSNELYKGIVIDRASCVFNGKVIVRPDAQKINAFQQNSTLLLSEHASMDSKPQLEIFADDVRCSHGATIGQLDENAMFYLRSRGLPASKARALLQMAFLQEVLSAIKIEPLRERISAFVNDKLHLA